MTETKTNRTSLTRAAARRLWRWSFLGLYFGFVWAIYSTTPSLVPRPWYLQGMLAGVVFSVGYTTGVGIMWLWSYLELPILPRKAQFWIKAALAVSIVIRAPIYLMASFAWQNDVRHLMDMPPLKSLHIPLMVLLAATLALTLVLITRSVILGMLSSGRFFHSYLQRRIAAVVGGAVFIAAIFMLVNGWLVSGAITLIDQAQAAADVRDPPGAQVPTETQRSGNPTSLIGWDDLGQAGKRFVTEGPRRDEIASFSGDPAMEPIRAYVGLRAADTAMEQAGLALEELKRTQAFERKVLVLATPTGTGWVDDNSIAAVEYMHRGDVATVAVQYSYMKSPLSLILEPGRSQASAKIVFDVIYDHWRSIPTESRPRLYLFGLSLGSLGSETSPPLFAWVSDPFDGAVWAGPTFRNSLWRAIRRDRNEGSYDWLPHFEDGSMIRVLGQDNSLADQGEAWGRMRIVYIAYPSDAIVFFEERMWYRRPEWLVGEQGADISDLLVWRPIVGFLQVAVDMLSAASVPAGHGHNYAPESYIDAWVAVSDPDDWSEDMTVRLKRQMLGGT